MDALVQTASSTFVSTIGFSWDSVLDFVGDMIKLIIGSGLGVFQASLAWIMVLVAIGVIVGLIYGAYRFFKH